MPLHKTKEDALMAAMLVGLGASLTVVASKTVLRYKPGKVWKFVEQGGTWGKLNRPTAGPQSNKQLPRGEHPLQLYSLGTPNGQKVTILLEELNLKYGIEYDAYFIDIGKSEQFSQGFVEANPNSKIPALLHYENGTNGEPIRVFETAAILLYLCEKFDKEHLFLPQANDPAYAECLSWLSWVQGSAPYLGGGFGHFFSYAPIKIKYAIDRYAMETKRQLDVLDRHLGGKDGNRGGRPYLCGDRPTIADFACWPWYGTLALGQSYGSATEFLQADKFTHVVAWAKRMEEREGVKRGRIVNKRWGPEEEQLEERHSSEDFLELERKKNIGATEK